MIKGRYLLGALLIASTVCAQDYLPRDTQSSYHPAPRYRESESHPLRLVAYVLHPIGWVLREGIFRPISYFASSTETTREIMGYREPFDYREPQCFSGSDVIPDCHSVLPYNYASVNEEPEAAEEAGRDVLGAKLYFPDVNFDFDQRKLNDLGVGRVHQLAELVKTTGNVEVVLEGNADYIGNPDYNQKLAMDRAEAVRKELVALGVPQERIKTVSFGETKPVFSEETGWARAVNRRVEVKTVQ